MPRSKAPAKKRAHLHVVEGDRPSERNPSAEAALSKIMSGRAAPRPKSRGRRREAPPVELPREISKYADVYAAGRAIEREVKLKADFARQELERFCIEDIAQQYAAVGRRPSSRNFTAAHSRFKFVLTERTTVTPEKGEALKDLGIDLDRYTEVTGIQINYDAIRQHHLEGKLRDALASMRVSADVIEEIFSSQVKLKESFYEVLPEIVNGSLKTGEKLEEKIRETLEVLGPATQIRNVEVIGLSAKQSFDLVNEAEIEAQDIEDEIA